MLVFHNGVVHALDEQDSRYEAIATLGTKIARVGDSAALLGEFPEAERVDLHGAHVYPGFVDAHAHIYGMGERLTKPRLDGTRSKEEIYSRLSTIKRGEEGSSQWIISRGWDQTHWSHPSFPNRHDLDHHVSAEQPIALTRIDGHALWCNSLALAIAGVDRTTPDPPGGAILHDEQGEPTGILLDEAMKLVESKIPPVTKSDLIASLRVGLHYFLKRGHVAVHEMGVTKELWEAYEALYASEGESLPRALVFLDMTKETGKQLFLKSYSPSYASRRGLGGGPSGSRLTCAGIKLYLDGALGSRGAALFDDYSDDPGNRGLALMEDGEALDLMRIAADNGLQIAVHAIGDRANARALDLFERLLHDAKPGPRRPILRIEHAQIVRDQDLKRFAALGVFALVQPAFFKSDRRWAVERLGAERMKTAYRWKSFLDSGVPFVASSDAPIEEPDPLAGIELLMNRDGVGDREALDRMSQAVASYAHTAYALSGETGIAGSLAAGMKADLTIVDATHSSIVDVVMDGKRMGLVR